MFLKWKRYFPETKNGEYSVHTVLSGMGSSENGTVLKWLQSISVETDCDVVHCPTVGNKE